MSLIASSFLQVSNAPSAHLTLEQRRVFQVPGFSPSERSIQRMFCTRKCGWMPVCLDLSFESVRSRLALALLVIQLCTEFMWSVILPALNFSGMTTCAAAVALLEPALLATLTGIVGLIALSFFLPLFSLLGGVNAR